MRLLITSGGTKIPIDSVRSITNMSKGTFGAKIATEALKREHSVCFLRAKNSDSPFQINFDLRQCGTDAIPDLLEDVAVKHRLSIDSNETYQEHQYDTFDEYATKLETLLMTYRPDAVVLAAAVSDYGTAPIQGKARSRSGEMNIALTPLPKLIGKVKNICPKAILVGFKLLVNSTDTELMDAAEKSINDNGCDFVVANDLSDIKNGNHKILIVRKGLDARRFSANDERNEGKDPNYLAGKVLYEIEYEVLS